jgi:hypothetical protein
LTAIVPHHHLTLTSPQVVQNKIPGLQLTTPGSTANAGSGTTLTASSSHLIEHKGVINPLLSQLLDLNKDSADYCADQPSLRRINDNINGVSTNTIFEPAKVPSVEPFQQLDAIIKSENNARKETSFIKQAIQHDISTGLLKLFPGDMIFDCFLNIDLPPTPSCLVDGTNPAKIPPYEQLISRLYPTPQLRGLVYDAWSLPHSVDNKNVERYMYERLNYNDRFQNIRVLGDTLRVKEPKVVLPSSQQASVGGFLGQDVKTQKLLHHTRHPLSKNNKNAFVLGLNTGQNVMQQSPTGQELPCSTLANFTTLQPNPQTYPTTLELTSGYNIHEFMKDPINIWNRRPTPNSKTKDNLFMFQEGHKLYSLSIWIALFSWSAHPPESLSTGVTDQQRQLRIEWFEQREKEEKEKNNGISVNFSQQSQKDVYEVYRILKLLQQKAVCDAVFHVFLPPQKR